MITTRDLQAHGSVFQKMTGLRVEEFERWIGPVLERFAQAEEARLTARVRQRALGGGDHPTLSAIDQVVMTLVWLRLYPTQDVLGYLFGVSAPTVGRYLRHVVPVLERMGLDQLRQPDPGRKRRRSLPALLADMPALQVIVDSFEQSVQRPRRAADREGWYSGKKRCHTLKVQVMVEAETGQIVSLSESVPGRTADITLLRQSGVLERLPPALGVLGDCGYQGIARLHASGRSPHKRNKGSPPLSAQQRAYNHAFASVRIVVENTIGRLRHFQSLNQRDRQHRCPTNHHSRVCAVAGLVNFQLTCRCGL